MDIKEYEQMQPHVQLDGLIFMTPNQHCAWRVETLYTKEPDTVAWIRSMKEGEVFYDVGANMGQYSLLAAKAGLLVHAFEPESQNFALMCKNIAVNKMSDKIKPWPIALSDVDGLDMFFVTSLLAGSSCNAFGEQLNYQLQKKEFQFAQGCYGMKLDKFIDWDAYITDKDEYQVSIRRNYPAHIKIDVDGFEHKVLEGAKCALMYAKSVLVETNTALKEHTEIESFMIDHGLYPDLETAEKARRTEGPFKGIGNVIYFRNEDDFLSKKAK